MANFDGTRGNKFPFILQRYSPTLSLESTLSLNAYFRGEIRHDSSPTWDMRQDIGRADPKYMYQTFARTLSFSFDLVAEDDRKPATYIRNVLNELENYTMPQYFEGRGFQGHYIKFTIGRLYVGQYGVVTSLSTSFDNSQITWDRDKLLPMFATVSMSIAWIGKQRPGVGTKSFG